MTRERGPAWDASRSRREQRNWNEHAVAGAGALDLALGLISGGKPSKRPGSMVVWLLELVISLFVGDALAKLVWATIVAWMNRPQPAQVQARRRLALAA